MNAARRNADRRGWPRGLYSPRPGYFIFRTPDGRVLPIGRVPLAHAKAEAIAANQHLAGVKPTLVDTLSGKAHTVAEVIPKMKPAQAANTARGWRSLDGKIVAALGEIHCGRLTVADCAAFLEGEHDELLAYGWQIRTWTARKGYALTDEAVGNSASETIWCSPGCVAERNITLGLFDEQMEISA